MNLKLKRCVLLQSEDLKYLNHNYAFPVAHINRDAGGLLGKLYRKIANVLKRRVLSDYLEEQKQFNAHLVRVLNDIVKIADRSFWEEVRLQQEVALVSLEKKLGSDLDDLKRQLLSQLDSLQARQQSVGARLATLESIAAGLERITALSGNVKPNAADVSFAAAATVDYSYVLLENRFRGGEAEISQRLLPYVDVFKGVELPVLEIGSGRGELQKLLRTAGIPGYGVESDDGMYSVSVAEGLDIRHEDGLAHLRSLSDGSLGGIVAIQVIEHLPLKVLKDLLGLAAKKVRAGGKVVFETINSESLLALMSNYFRDPTHVAPLHPETMEFMMGLAGINVSEVRKLSPYPPEACLRKLSEAAYMTPHWRADIELINQNFELLNRIIFGYQDYCIIGEVC